jgi:hypothetical protein
LTEGNIYMGFFLYSVCVFLMSNGFARLINPIIKIVYNMKNTWIKLLLFIIIFIVLIFGLVFIVNFGWIVFGKMPFD